MTTDNEAGVATGWLAGELSPAGLRQAADLGRRRCDDGVDAVLTSDLGRAVQTAELAFAGTSIPVHQDERLRECDYGTLNGAPVERLHPRHRFITRAYPGGQSYRAVVDQTRDFLADVSRTHAGERVVVIAHSANRWALQHLLDGVPLEDLVDAPFGWQPGWEFQIPAGWSSP